MRLLFDQNLSPRLVECLADLCPDAAHIAAVGLDRATDQEIWDYARDNEYVIVTKDADFSDLVLIQGYPPKVVWLRLGNCTTHQIEALFRKHYQAIEAFKDDPDSGTLALL